MFYFVTNLLEPLFISIKTVSFSLEPLFLSDSNFLNKCEYWGYEHMRIRGYQQTPRTHEPKDMGMWVNQQAHRVYDLKVKRMWGYKQGHTNLRI